MMGDLGSGKSLWSLGLEPEFGLYDNFMRHAPDTGVRLPMTMKVKAGSKWNETVTIMKSTSGAKIRFKLEKINEPTLLIYDGPVEPVDSWTGVVPTPMLDEAVEFGEPGDVFALEYEVTWGGQTQILPSSGQLKVELE